MRKLVYITFLLICTSSLFAQNKLTNAIYSLKNNELDKAKQLIDAAAEDTLFSNDAVTWYFRGFIYKNLFKEREAQLIESPFREQSIQYFRKSLELQPEGTYADGSRKGLSFLAQTLFNQSVALFTQDINAVVSYSLVKEIASGMDPMDPNLNADDWRFSIAALGALKAVSEDYMVKIFTKSQLLAFHGKRVTVTVQDMKIAMWGDPLTTSVDYKDDDGDLINVKTLKKYNWTETKKKAPSATAATGTGTSTRTRTNNGAHSTAGGTAGGADVTPDA